MSIGITDFSAMGFVAFASLVTALRYFEVSVLEKEPFKDSIGYDAVKYLTKAAEFISLVLFVVMIYLSDQSNADISLNINAIEAVGVAFVFAVYLPIVFKDTISKYEWLKYIFLGCSFFMYIMGILSFFAIFMVN